MSGVSRHRLPRVRLLLAALLVVFPCVLQVQELPLLRPGTRVRLVAPEVSPTPLVGEIVRNEGDTLVLGHRGAQTVVPTSAIRSAEASWDRRGVRHVAIQTANGILVGAALGAGYVLVNSSESGAGTIAAVVGSMGAGAGGGIGLLVGIAGAGERWRPIPVLRESARPLGAPELTVGLRLAL